MFWLETDVNILEYNRKQVNGPWLRLERYPPYVYAVKATAQNLIAKSKNKIEWFLVKVGFTQREDDTARVKEIIAELGGEGEVLFQLKQSPLDTTIIRDVEARFRKRLGFSVPKKKAKDLGLPVPTEWVMVSSGRLQIFGEEFKKYRDPTTLTLSGMPKIEGSDGFPQELTFGEVSISLDEVEGLLKKK